MKARQIVIIAISLFTVSIAHAQYYGPPGYPPPPPPTYAPPPGYVPPPAPTPGPPPEAGPYFRAGVGPTFFQDSSLKSYGFGSAGYNGPSGKVDYNVGVSGYAAFGYAFNRYVGLDFQTGYTWGQMNSVQNYVANDSTMGNVPFLANVTLSMPIPHSNIVPYIGGGLGGSDSIFNARTFYPVNAPINNNTLYGSESDVVFAWQAFAGVRFRLDPNFSLGIGYDFFETGNPTFSYPPGPNLNAEFQGIRAHTIMFTLQANF